MMQSGQDFVDFYSLLQVRSTCDAAMLEKAYRHLAQQYHPDHSETADVEKFQSVIEAYKTLRDPDKRREYDAIYRQRRKDNFFEFAKNEEIQIDHTSAIEDAEAHQKILFTLYKRRREDAEEPGVMRYHLQSLLGCSDESFGFHLWYLKSKGFIQIMQDSSLAITIEGVDHVILTSRSTEAAKLLTSQVDLASNA